MRRLKRWRAPLGLFFAVAAAIGVVYGALRWYGGLSPVRAKPSDLPLTAAAGAPSRIVSLAPSLTEILFAVDAGGQVIGVTRYCAFPPETKERISVGGMTDTDYETLLSLHPDLVVLRSNLLQESQRQKCAQLKLPVCVVSDDTVEGILSAIAALGEQSGHVEKATLLIADLRRRMEQLRQSVPAQRRPRVLLIVGRTVGLSSLKEVYAVGPNNYLDEVLTLAGGSNALESDAPAFPRLGPEDIVRLNPDVIVDLFSPEAVQGVSAKVIAQDWRQLPNVQAVSSGQIHVVIASYAVIPGPRFILLAEDLARLMRQNSYSPAEADAP